MIRVIVETRAEEEAVHAALGRTGLDYVLTGAPPAEPFGTTHEGRAIDARDNIPGLDHMPGDGRNMELLTEEEHRARHEASRP